MKLLLSGLLMGMMVTASGVELVRDGEARAAIRVCDDAPASVRFASEELRKYVKLATGVELPILTGKEEKNPLPGTVKLGYGADIKGVGRFGYVAAAKKNELVLHGMDHRIKEFKPEKLAESGMISASTGTLFAVYDFLDRELGVRFLWPGELGTFVPKRDSLVLEDFHRVGRPPLECATFRLSPQLSNPKGWSKAEAKERYFAAASLWTIRHGFASRNYWRGGHAFRDYWQRFGKTRPDFFAQLPDGSRRPLKGDAKGSRISMCVSNPDFHRQIIEDFKKKPKEVLSVCENDIAGLCTCERCRSWDAPQPGFATHPYWSKGEIPELGNLNAFMRIGEDGGNDASGASLTDRYAKFYLAVQKLAREVKPDVKLYGHAYVNFVKPPLETILNSDIVIGYVGWPYFPFTPAEMERIRADWDGWKASEASMVLRPNSTHSGHNLPLQYARKLGEAYRYCFASGALVGVDFDSLRGEFGVQGPMFYTLARLTARPDLTVETILDEYYSAFGPAKAAVKAYFDYGESVADAVTAEDWQKWNDIRGRISFKNWLSVADFIFTPEVFARMNALLGEAAVAAADDPESLARVTFLQCGLKNAELTVEALKRKYRFDASGTPADRDAWQAALQELAACRAAHEDQFISNMGYLYYRENHGSKLYR